MDETTRDEQPTAGTEGSRDERPSGPPRPTDPYPQPVQEVVDPNDPDPLEDRTRTEVSGARIPRSDED